MALQFTDVRFLTDATGVNQPIRVRRDRQNALPDSSTPVPFDGSAQEVVAYSITDDHVDQITIRAKVTNTGSTAIETTVSLEDASALRLLGSSDRLQVSLAAGETVDLPFEMRGVKLSRCTLGIYEANLIWLERTIARAQTVVDVYALLGPPGKPWSTTPNSPALPWTTVLDYVCTWARGATSPEEVATRVTEQVYRLGRTPYPSPATGGSTYFAYRVRTDFRFLPFYRRETDELHEATYNLEPVLQRLRGVTPRSSRFTCQDCASAVALFTNAVGGELVQAVLGSTTGLKIEMNYVLLIGEDDDWSIPDFNVHEVAWKQTGECLEEGMVWDACLAIDKDRVPGTPRGPEVPCGMMFQTRDPLQSYSVQLANGLGVASLLRRNVVPTLPSHPREKDLKDLFPFDYRAPADWPPTPIVHISLDQMVEAMVSVLTPFVSDVSQRSLREVRWGEAVELTWTRQDATLTPTHVNATLFDCGSQQWAYDFLWQNISRTHVAQERVNELPGICYVDRHGNASWAYGQFVWLMERDPPTTGAEPGFRQLFDLLLDAVL